MARFAAIVATFVPFVFGADVRASDIRPVLQGASRRLASTNLGCYSDSRNRALSAASTSADDMDPTVCATFCADYPYYGVEYGKECYCGDYTSDYDANGASTSCDVACAGDSSLTCGGAWAIEVYAQAMTDSSSIGCYADSRSRVLTALWRDSGMSPSVCIAYCQELGYYYAATQWGEECWCGDEDVVIDVNGDATCERPCAGDPTTFCGDAYAFTAYTTETDSASNYLGCYTDVRGSGRVFVEMTTSDENDAEFCEDYCAGLGYSFFGLQYGEECWCGGDDTDVTQWGTAVCDIECTGDSTQTCGGRFAFDAYTVDATTETDDTDDTDGTDDPDDDLMASCDTCPSMSPLDPMPVPAPSPIMEIPEYDPDCAKASVRWASSTGPAGRAYFENGGCATLTDLYNERSDNTGAKGPIYILDENDDVIEGPTEPTGRWLLKGELYVEDGSVLYVHGTSIGGDCDELRIQSDEDGLFHEIRGHGGSLSFKSTLVTSWNTVDKTPDTDHSDGRSFLNCVSEKANVTACVGQAKNDMGECRMDIIDSEMGYMGFFDSESYGLTWKVRGFCVDKSNPEVFDETNVYGDIQNSDIHDMYYGMYSYGHQGGVWTDNIMRDNIQYGFDPHDDSDYLTIARNTVYNNGNHGIIASKRCNDVEIYDNEVYNGGAQAAGIFLHRSTDSAKVYGNYVHDMYDAGLANLESFDAEIYDNVFENVKYGMRISLGGGNNYVHDNTFDTCTQYGLFTYEGSDDPEVGDGRPINNMFVDNEIKNTEVGVKIKEADDTYIVGNTFTDIEELQFADAYGTIWCNNDIPDDICMDTQYNGTTSTFAYGCDLPPEC